jgi:hypothetical protein
MAAEDDADPEVELEEQVAVEPPKSAKRAAKKSPRSARPTREPGPTVFHLNPSQVSTLIGEQPGLLEKGLGIYADETGKPVGAHYPSPVGEIDLLARDPKGNFVVIMVPEPSDVVNVVADILQRMGWVRKHIAGDGKEVRGIVVLEQLPEEVAYAAAGTGGAVAFKAFRGSGALDTHGATTETSRRTTGSPRNASDASRASAEKPTRMPSPADSSEGTHRRPRFATVVAGPDEISPTR